MHSLESVTVRPAVEADLPAIREISNWAIVHTAANFHTEPETLNDWQRTWAAAQAYPWFVAVAEGGVVGYAFASAFKARCAYDYTAEVSVYLDHDYYGHGIGRRLYEHLIPALDRQGYQSLIAVIALPNEASVRLHERFGFEPVGVLKRVGWKFDRWHDVGYWQRLRQPLVETPSAIGTVAEAIRVR